MKITAILNEKELNEAIQKYVTEAGYDVQDKEVEITLTKGRKGNGTYANVDFTPIGEIHEDDSDSGDESDSNLFSSESTVSSSSSGDNVLRDKENTPEHVTHTTSSMEDLKASIFN